MLHVAPTLRICAVCLALGCTAPVAASAADPGPPPGIPAAPAPERTPVPDTSDPANSQRTTAWKKAVDDADAARVEDLLEPRPIAAVIGTLWFLLTIRSRWRGRGSSRSAA